jgi:hypothetical protein
LADALALVNEAAGRLWMPEGGKALAYLHGRGLKDETIRDARLGWTPAASIPTRNGDRCYYARGVVIPWFDRDRLALVKIRQPEGREPKYAEAFRDRPRIFPGPDVIEAGRPLVIVEGELDTILLGQELRDLAAVVTLGSASSRPAPTMLGMMLAAAPWFISTDADSAGDKAASGWPAQARRVRPPGAFKDWTEAAQGGVNLRRWWSDRLGGTEAPKLFDWDELAAQRWGPARDDATPGIVIDQPRPAPVVRVDSSETVMLPEATPPPFEEPAAGPDPLLPCSVAPDVLHAILALDWDGQSWAEIIESGRRWNSHQANREGDRP